MSESLVRVNTHVLERCREHARFLDDIGNDGDGEDVKELISYVQALREERELLRANLRAQQRALQAHINSLRQQLAEALVKPQIHVPPEMQEQAVRGAFMHGTLSGEHAAYMLGMTLVDFVRLPWVKKYHKEKCDGNSTGLDRRAGAVVGGVDPPGVAH